MPFYSERRPRAALVLVDGLCAALALLLVTWARGDDWLANGRAADAAWAVGLAALLVPLALARSGSYSTRRRRSLVGVLRGLIAGTATGLVALVAACSALSLSGISPETLGVAALLQLAALAAGRVASHQIERLLRRRGYDRGSFIVIGTGPRARRLAQEVESNPDWGLCNRGFFDDAPTRRDFRVLGEQYRGATKEVAEFLRKEAIDEVFVALPRRHLCSESTAELVALCEAVGIEVTVAGDLFPTHRARALAHELLGVPGITFDNYPHRSPLALAVKRSIDFVGACVGLLLLAPLGLVVALAIKLDSPGPVFFVQPRCTLRGRTFPFLKFRTMDPGAEDRLEALRERNEVSGPVFKMRDDPRVTRVGGFLRRFSIDELPQLVNVLLGHMSLVGPRPPIPGEVDHYDLSDRRRLSVRPGLTCLWQIRGRSLVPFDEWVRLDLEYIDRWSLGLDLLILLQTPRAVLRGDGAS